MRFILSFFIFSFIVTIGTSKAQNVTDHKTVPDTTIEKVIYEYDTVYLAPDTIKLVDTIVNYMRDKANKKHWSLKQKIQHIFSFPNSSYTSSQNEPLEGFFPGKVIKHNWSFLISVEPYVPGLFDSKKLNDSITFKRVANVGFNVGLVYHKTNFIYGIGLGYSSFHEQIHYQGQYYTSNLSQNGSSSYDSLSVTKNSTLNNYFKFLDIHLSAGYDWTFGKISLTLSTVFSSDILLDYNALEYSNEYNYRSVNSSSIRTVNFSVGIKSSVGYKFSKRCECFVAPFYDHLLNSTDKYPLTVISKTGLDLGLRIIL